MESVRRLVGALRQHALSGLGRGNAHAWILSGTIALAGLGAAAVSAAPASHTPVKTVNTLSSTQQNAGLPTYYPYRDGDGDGCHHHHWNGSGTLPVNDSQP